MAVNDGVKFKTGNQVNASAFKKTYRLISWKPWRHDRTYKNL